MTEPKTQKIRIKVVNGSAKPCGSALRDRMEQMRVWIRVLVKGQRIEARVGTEALRLIDKAQASARDGLWDDAVQQFLAAYGMAVKGGE